MSSVTPPDREQRLWIKNIAYSVNATYPEVDVEDIQQQLYLEWFENWDAIKGYVTVDDDGKGKAQLLTAMQRWAIAYAKRERAAMLGFNPDDQVAYSKPQLRDMLPLVESPESWSSFAAEGGDRSGGRSTADPAEGGTRLAMYADLRRAWERLTDEERVILRLRYFGASEESWEALGELLDVTPDAARKRCERALGKMQRFLSGEVRERGGDVARRVLSNAQAVALQSGYWEG